jgi:transcriptional regulator with XRE-family HTH domain
MDGRSGSLGAVIRARRKKAGLTLEAVAKKADFSISYLSQIERNLLTPSVSTLKRVADVLNIPAGQLMFTGEGRDSTTALVSVVRKKERKRLSFPGSKIHYELITPDMRRRASMLWVTAPPGSESGTTTFAHDGEDGVLVLKGELQIEIASVWHTLKAGDSIYFNAGLPHRWRNIGSVSADAIWLSTPPSF